MLKKPLLLLVLIVVAPTLSLATLAPVHSGVVVDFYMDRPMSNAKLFVQVYAVMPDQPSIEVYRGFVYNNRLVLDKTTLSKPLKAWQNKNVKDYKTSLIIDAWLITPNKNLWILRDKTILYNPTKITEGNVEYFNIHINPKQAIEIKPLTLDDNMNKYDYVAINVDASVSKVEPNYEWCLDVWIPVADKTYTLTNTEIPLLILNNSLTTSSLVIGSLTIYTSSGIRTELGIAYGYNLENYGLNAPDLELTIGGPTYEKYAWFSDIITVYPTQFKYIYIKGNITHEFYKLYNTCYGYTGYEKERVLINAIYVDDNNRIEGGQHNGVPSSQFIELLLNANKRSYYTTLNPGDSISLMSIAQSYDECSTGLSIGVALGAILAVAAPETIPASMITLMSALDINVRAYSTTYIDGAIKNNGTNIPEYIFIGESKIEYTNGLCKYKIPVYYIDSG